MQLVHISTIDIYGAGNAACGLHEALRDVGVQSHMLVLKRHVSAQGLVEFVPARDVPFGRLRNNLLRQRSDCDWSRSSVVRSKYEKMTDDRTMHRVERHQLVRSADVIHLHWIAEYVNYLSFFAGVRGKPMVWTLHDMNPFTGGCHYASNCTRYEQCCGACPQLQSLVEQDVTRRIWQRKQRAFAGQRLHVATPSKWLAQCAERSTLLRGFPVSVIPNSIPSSAFPSCSREESRRVLGLPPEKTIMVFSAMGTGQRKGAVYLQQALARLGQIITSTQSLSLLIFGSFPVKLLSQSPFPFHSLGYLNDPARVTHCYNAADFLVVPSLQDNLPNVILEAFAAAIPVVGFRVGGIPDMVFPGETGLLATPENSDDLAQKMLWMLEHPEERRRMGICAQVLARTEYSPQLQAQRYLEVYDTLLHS
ncbi:hypothetical protein COU80_04570 [Candidatus Peregrinibacteria bacterium CG10_big_fil_rev_8_21_14_0_10_55_24]|nr:MAG: hypothetical protein COU80_04570 [Candidatus Peregrinibacteria bacterium CG10_big_fil_rev_8_21_14_0_10_55_24]